MAIYRFKISFEDYDEVIREIDMLPRHTFLDLHYAIQKNLGYDPERSSSFYTSNDHWRKGKEIAYLPAEKKKEKGIIPMEDARLNQFIVDPHQKFYYTYNFERPYDFHVQLIKILKEEDGKIYPDVFKSIGQAPKPINQATIMENTSEDEDNKEFDFLNVMEYENDDVVDMEVTDDEEDTETDNDRNEGEGSAEDDY